MTLVVTGAAGFLGSALLSALLADGAHVVAVDRRPLAPRPGLTVLTGDLTDGDPAVGDALGSADAVYHLAGCPGVRDASPDVAERRRRDNVLATAAVLASVRPSTPLLVTSSSSVYGGTEGGRPCAEDQPPRPRGGYARSKVLTEALCRARAQAGGRVTVVRPFTVAGEGQRPDMALSRWLAAARAGRPLHVLGSLDRTRDVTDVADVVRAMRALLARDAVGTVNVGTGTGHSLRALVDAVAAALDLDVHVDLAPASTVEPPDTRADTTRLRRLTGIVPVTDLPALVARQARAQGLLPRAAAPEPDRDARVPRRDAADEVPEAAA